MLSTIILAIAIIACTIILRDGLKIHIEYKLPEPPSEPALTPEQAKDLEKFYRDQQSIVDTAHSIQQLFIDVPEEDK